MQIKNTKVPKYQIIENDLIDKINHSIYKYKEAIPSEAELCKQYNCSRVTVRQALANLAHKGFIKKIQGSGAFVEKTKVIQRNPYIVGFTEDMISKGKVPRTEVNSFSVVTAGETICNLLNIEKNSPVYFIERTRYADDIAIMFERTYMSIDIHPNISLNILKNSKYQYAVDEGLNIEYSNQNITPIFASEYIAGQLDISTTQPMIKVANTTYLEDGKVFDHSELYLHPELYQLNMVKYKKK